MKKIFISYRRIDSYETNRLATSLKTEYGEDSIFLDYESIHGGDVWPEAIKAAVEAARVMIVIIGKNWLFMQDEVSGKRKIDMENDWVRKEIIIFLQRYQHDRQLLVLPVLINGAKMPGKEHLDPEINTLCDFHALELLNTMSEVDFVSIKRRLVNAGIYTTEPLPVVTPVGDIPPDSLTHEEEQDFLATNRLWKIRERVKPGSIGETIRELYRVYEFRNYDEAWKFMTVIDQVGIKPNNHHPRWQNTYHRVEVWLCTFNISHKPSKRDLRLASIMEDTWKAFAMGLQ